MNATTRGMDVLAQSAALCRVAVSIFAAVGAGIGRLMGALAGKIEKRTYLLIK